MKYVVYLTYYTGDLLPPFYIGSSDINKIKTGYNGSVKSIKWKELYQQEQTNNKNKFRTRVLSYHNSRKDALIEELRLQKMHKVIKNPKYFNEAYATVNGYFGRDVSGANHPMYGKTHSEKTKKHWSITRKGSKVSEETKAKISKANKGKPGVTPSPETIEKMRKAHLGKKQSQETIAKRAAANRGQKRNEGTKNKMSEKAKGTGNSQFKGYYLFKGKKYVSTELADLIGVSVPSIIIMCRNNTKVITRQAYNLSNFLQTNYTKEVIGKTWGELGFSYQTVK